MEGYWVIINEKLGFSILKVSHLVRTPQLRYAMQYVGVSDTFPVRCMSEEGIMRPFAD